MKSFLIAPFISEARQSSSSALAVREVAKLVVYAEIATRNMKAKEQVTNFLKYWSQKIGSIHDYNAFSEEIID